MHVLPPAVVFFIVIVRPIICEDLPGQLYKNLKIRFYDANNMIPVYGLPIKIQQRQSSRDQNFNSGMAKFLNTPEQFTVLSHPALFEEEGVSKNETLLFQSPVDIHFQNAHKTQKTAKARTLCVYLI